MLKNTLDKMKYFRVGCVRCNHAKSYRVIRSVTVGGAIRKVSAACLCNHSNDDTEKKE